MPIRVRRSPYFVQSVLVFVLCSANGEFPTLCKQIPGKRVTNRATYDAWQYLVSYVVRLIRSYSVANAPPFAELPAAATSQVGSSVGAEGDDQETRVQEQHR